MSLLLDGIGIALYFGIIAILRSGNGWYFALALPIVAAATGMIWYLRFCEEDACFHFVGGSVGADGSGNVYCDNRAFD